LCPHAVKPSNMEISYFNGNFLPADQIQISPDDRGFLFADGVYEVIRWYEGFFYDMDGHMARLKRSMEGIRLSWEDANSFPSVAHELIRRNGLYNLPVLVYLQVTRGVARRSHAFPVPGINPTVYAFARSFTPEKELITKGIKTVLMEDTRWARCDIKSVSLLPNILSFQDARDNGAYESVFYRDDVITECAHSNIFFVINNVLTTHPESNKILSGITRKNILHLAHEAEVPVTETALRVNQLDKITEAFVTNTSFEIAPVISINDRMVGEGIAGPVTKLLRDKFDASIKALRI
jgi:D-alanine transaminase